MVRRREDGRWEGRIVVGHKDDGSSLFHYVSAHSQHELMEKLHRSIEEYDGVDLCEESRMPLGEWLDLWYAECVASSLRPETKKNYHTCIENHIKPALGGRPLSKLTSADIQRLYRKLLKDGRVGGGPLSASMVRKIHGVLHQALNVAVERHLAVKNPSDDVTLPKREVSVRTILNDEQLETFMETIKRDPVWHDFFYVEMTTGLRRGELCGLKWIDFDEKKGTLFVRRTLHAAEGGGLVAGETKTRTGRRLIALPPSTVELLRGRKKSSGSEWIFPDLLHPENPVSPMHGYKKLKELLAEAHLPDLRFHDLRHTFATHALTSGVDAKTLSGILGHTKTSFTLDTYTHVTTDMQEKAAEIVGGFMGKLMVKE